MMMRPRAVLGACSVAIFGIVVVTTAALGPAAPRPWLVSSGILAVIMAVQSATSDPRELVLAMLFSLPPVFALVADGSPTWLIGPLGVLLLVAGELNALCWDVPRTGPLDAVKRRRLFRAGQLAGLGLVGSLLVVAIASGPSPDGTLTVAVASVLLVVLGRAVLRRNAGMES